MRERGWSAQAAGPVGTGHGLGDHSARQSPGGKHKKGLVLLAALGLCSGALAQVEIAHLIASDGALGDYFGISVAIDGNTAVIGAYYDDIGSNVNQGSAYVYVWDGSNWVFQAKLTASDGAAGDVFGCSVAISGITAVIGDLGPTGGARRMCSCAAGRAGLSRPS